jgi:anti-sigma factor RsiW
MKMNCKLVESLLPNYLDDELSEELSEQVRAHLIRCRECAWEVESIRQSLEALKQASRAEEPSADFRERLLSQLIRDHRTAMAGKPYQSGRARQRTEPELIYLEDNPLFRRTHNG